MKRTALLFLLPLLSLAQPEFFGYFESEASNMVIGTETYSYGFNKLRLDVEARPNDHVLIGANVNFQKYWGKTTWNVYDFIPGYQDMGLVMNIELQDTVLLDNMYMRVSLPVADITIGRQQISPGVGYAWNPTDIFNTKSLMDPSYEQTGVPALRLYLPVGGRASVDLVIQPEESWDNSTKQVSLKSGVGRFDVALTTSLQAKDDWSSTLLGRTEVRERQMVGGSVIGELLEWGVWVEGAQNTLQIDPPPWSSYIPGVEKEETFNEYVLGADHTFDNTIYFLAEYLHNGSGIAKKADLTIPDYLSSLTGETHSLMQDYAFLYTMHPTFDYVSLSAILIANLNDKSGMLNPMLEWNAFEDTNLRLQGSLAWGDDDTEFGLQNWGLALRVTSNF